MRLVKNGLCVAVLAAAAVVQAEPLNLKQVSADAGWLGHVDFDALRNSTVVSKMVQRHLERHKETEAHLKLLEGLTELNLMTDLHGMTFYGKQLGKHSGVVIFHAKLNKALLQPWADRAPHREVSSYGPHSIQSWAHKDHGHSHTVSLAWYGDNRIVLASGVDDLKAAIDVLDGKSASLGPDAPLAGNVPPGTTILFRARGISNIECKEPLVKQIDSFRWVAGEHNGESFSRWRLETNDAETAGSLKEVTEGLRALLALHYRNNETGKKLVNATRIKLDEKTLTVLWSAPADDVWTITEAHIKIIEAHLAKHREHRKQGDRHGHGGQTKTPAIPKPEKAAEEDF